MIHHRGGNTVRHAELYLVGRSELRAQPQGLALIFRLQQNLKRWNNALVKFLALKEDWEARFDR